MYNSLTIKSLFLFALISSALLAAGNANAQQVVVDPNSAKQSIANAIEYFEDSSETLTIDDVLAPDFGTDFIPHNRDILHFGITSSAYWIRINLDWSEAGANTTRILEFGPPKLVAGIARGGIELFTVSDDGQLLSEYSLGTLTNARELKTLNRGFALGIDAEFGNQIYLRITSARPLRLPISIWSEEGFRLQSMRADTVRGIQYGVLLALIFYNLFLYISIRENSYLFYVVAVTAQMGFLFLDSKHRKSVV